MIDRPPPAANPGRTDNTPAGQRFQRHQRLLHRAQFDAVFKAADFRQSEHPFTVLGRANGGSGARLGVALTKRNLPRAVDRNRIRRLVRETFRQHVPTIDADLVVMARSQAVQRDNATLTLALERLWQRLSSQQPL